MSARVERVISKLLVSQESDKYYTHKVKHLLGAALKFREDANKGVGIFAGVSDYEKVGILNTKLDRIEEGLHLAMIPQDTSSDEDEDKKELPPEPEDSTKALKAGTAAARKKDADMRAASARGHQQKLDSEQQAKAAAVAEQQAKADAEQQAKATAEQQVKSVAEQQDKTNAEQQLKALTEQRDKADAEQQAKTSAEQQVKAAATAEQREKSDAAVLAANRAAEEARRVEALERARLDALRSAAAAESQRIARAAMVERWREQGSRVERYDREDARRRERARLADIHLREEEAKREADQAARAVEEAARVAGEAMNAAERARRALAEEEQARGEALRRARDTQRLRDMEDEEADRSRRAAARANAEALAALDARHAAAEAARAAREAAREEQGIQLPEPPPEMRAAIEEGQRELLREREDIAGRLARERYGRSGEAHEARERIWEKRFGFLSEEEQEAMEEAEARARSEIPLEVVAQGFAESRQAEDERARRDLEKARRDRQLLESTEAERQRLADAAGARAAQEMGEEKKDEPDESDEATISRLADTESRLQAERERARQARMELDREAAAMEAEAMREHPIDIVSPLETVRPFRPTANSPMPDPNRPSRMGISARSHQRVAELRAREAALLENAERERQGLAASLAARSAAQAREADERAAAMAAAQLEERLRAEADFRAQQAAEQAEKDTEAASVAERVRRIEERQRERERLQQSEEKREELDEQASGRIAAARRAEEQKVEALEAERRDIAQRIAEQEAASERAEKLAEEQKTEERRAERQRAREARQRAREEEQNTSRQTARAELAEARRFAAQEMAEREVEREREQIAAAAQREEARRVEEQERERRAAAARLAEQQEEEEEERAAERRAEAARAALAASNAAREAARARLAAERAAREDAARRAAAERGAEQAHKADLSALGDEEVKRLNEARTVRKAKEAMRAAKKAWILEGLHDPDESAAALDLESESDDEASRVSPFADDPDEALPFRRSSTHFGRRPSPAAAEDIKDPAAEEDEPFAALGLGSESEEPPPVFAAAPVAQDVKEPERPPDFEPLPPDFPPFPPNLSPVDEALIRSIKGPVGDIAEAINVLEGFLIDNGNLYREASRQVAEASEIADARGDAKYAYKGTVAGMRALFGVLESAHTNAEEIVAHFRQLSAATDPMIELITKEVRKRCKIVKREAAKINNVYGSILGALRTEMNVANGEIERYLGTVVRIKGTTEQHDANVIMHHMKNAANLHERMNAEMGRLGNDILTSQPIITAYINSVDAILAESRNSYAGISSDLGVLTALATSIPKRVTNVRTLLDSKDLIQAKNNELQEIDRRVGTATARSHVVNAELDRISAQFRVTMGILTDTVSVLRELLGLIQNGRDDMMTLANLLDAVDGAADDNALREVFRSAREIVGELYTRTNGGGGGHDGKYLMSKFNAMLHSNPPVEEFLFVFSDIATLYEKLIMYPANTDRWRLLALMPEAMKWAKAHMNGREMDQFMIRWERVKKIKARLPHHATR